MAKTAKELMKTNTQTTSLAEMINKSVNELRKALPSHMSAERLTRIALTTLRLNPKLYQCEPKSFLAALFQSAQLGLEPNIDGQAYIIPYWNNKKKCYEAQFQIGYKGLIELFYRHQKSISIEANEIKENDEFDYSYGTDKFLKHKPAFKDRGETIGYYAIAELNNTVIFKVASKEDIMEHAIKYSKCYDTKKGEFYPETPWAKHFDAMAKKTLLIQLTKQLPKSIEIQHALAMDETVKTEIRPDMLEVKDEMDWTDEVNEESENAEVKQPEEDKETLL